MTDIAFLPHDGTRLAYRHRPGSGPTVVFLPGFMSDMTGSKAEFLDGWAAERGRGFLRLDFSGCGASSGAFTDGTISRWADDARAVIAATVGEGPVVLVGSSMGGWIALRLAVALGARVRGLVGIAAAPDFTDWGIWDGLSEAERAAVMRDGRLERASEYGDAPYVYTRALIEDGWACRVMSGAIPYRGPVRLLQGQADPDVPWRLALDIAARVDSANIQVTLIKDGDHRLSRPQDLALLAATIEALGG
ncbi:MAG: alpha/beta hydrolase [Alphaproteobacteria bacterium]|nr:alpha/beta hydrolase [Alphaproteobacteria bacterium]